MNYKDYVAKKQKEYDDLPIFYAFSNEQFKNAMEERGLTEQDTDKVISLGIAGGFFLKKDRPIIDAYFQKKDVLPELMKDRDFAIEAFRYEMGNHEYFINWQADWDVCSCFGSCEYDESKTGGDYLREEGYPEEVVEWYYEARAQEYKYWEDNDMF